MPAAAASFESSSSRPGTTRLLSRRENQARGLAEYAIDFLAGRTGNPSPETIACLERFHVDSVGCGVSALAAGARAPAVLRRMALASPPCLGTAGGLCFGSRRPVEVARAVAANASAVREWDANGTNFGYDAARGRTAGEFGHNDFYPVAVAAARMAGLDGDATLRLMLLIDEIRGRLAEVFALRRYAIDHVHHGGVATAIGFAAALGGTAAQIESAIGMVVAHTVPFRAIRAGEQLSDSKGASAALAAEAAVTAALRALDGFVGPADVFRNPLAIYRLNEPCPDGESPFDLELGCSGDAFAIHGMHFKLGLYEHQSAGALQAVIDCLAEHPELASSVDRIREIRVGIYEPAYGIIADPAKRRPTTRQSADHSLPYILARSLLAAEAAVAAGVAPDWAGIMLLPKDYADERLTEPRVLALIDRITVHHGGPAYDRLYPDGIPTSVEIEHAGLGRLGGEIVRYPLGHAQADREETARLVRLKFFRLVAQAVDDPQALAEQMRLSGRTAAAIAELYAFPIHGIDPG
jgi:2-methylcitrate dehydratase